MSRRVRRRANLYTEAWLKFYNGNEEKVKVIGKSKSGKSLWVINAEGEKVFIQLKSIESFNTYI
jgi:hypothetical protein